MKNRDKILSTYLGESFRAFAFSLYNVYITTPKLSFKIRSIVRYLISRYKFDKFNKNHFKRLIRFGVSSVVDNVGVSSGLIREMAERAQDPTPSGSRAVPVSSTWVR